MIRQDRKKGGGGLMAFVREDLKAYRRRKLEPDQVESICLDVIDSRKSRFIICACYRSEKMSKPTDFLLLAHFCHRAYVQVPTRSGFNWGL